MNYEKTTASVANAKGKGGLENCWNEQIMERFIKANLFIACCIAAGLLLIVYLGAFSCEVSWILEARGDLPYSAYILCTQYFVVFVATTILIHGLVTGLPWGLFAWSIVIGLLSIPELIFVMIMTTQHWGLQSIHGLTELISYLVRLLINCFTLICVTPTGLRWRREAQVLTQLQDLATRLQLQTPSTPAPAVAMLKADSRRASKRLEEKQSAAFENAAFQLTDTTDVVGNDCQVPNMSLYGSQNEFNASTFALPLNGLATQMANNCNRAQSLMDLRCTLPGLYNPRYALENGDIKNGKYFNITIDDLKNKLQDSRKQTPSVMGSNMNDPIYCSIEASPTPQPLPPPPTTAQTTSLTEREPMPLPNQNGIIQQQQQQQSTKLTRNCVSLENLDGISKIQSDLLHNYNQQQQYYTVMLNYLQQQQHLQQMQQYHIEGGGGGGGGGGVYRQPISQTNLNGIYGSARMYQQHKQQQHYRRNSQPQQLQYYGGFGYVNYTNPYITANSKLSLGNESDDYRKYRDVAL